MGICFFFNFLWSRNSIFETKQKSLYFGTSKIIIFFNLFYQKLLLRTIGSNNLFLDLSGQAIFYVRDADRIRKKNHIPTPPPPLKVKWSVHNSLMITLFFLSSNCSLKSELTNLDLLLRMGGFV